MFGDLAFDKETRKFADPQQKLQEILAEIKWADELGIDVFALGEHHRPDYVVSSPEMVLSAAASITKNIKLMSAVTVLSSAEPVKVYQDFSTLDLISGFSPFFNLEINSEHFLPYINSFASQNL